MQRLQTKHAEKPCVRRRIHFIAECGAPGTRRAMRDECYPPSPPLLRHPAARLRRQGNNSQSVTCHQTYRWTPTPHPPARPRRISPTGIQRLAGGQPASRPAGQPAWQPATLLTTKGERGGGAGDTRVILSNSPTLGVPSRQPAAHMPARMGWGLGNGPTGPRTGQLLAS